MSQDLMAQIDIAAQLILIVICITGAFVMFTEKR